MSQEWEAIVFHESIEGGRAGCKLRIEGLRAIGETDKQEKFVLDLRHVQVSLGGTANTLIYLKPKDNQYEPTFSVRDRAILEALKEVGSADIMEQIQNFQKKVLGHRLWLVWCFILFDILLFGSIAFLYFYGADLAVKMIPYSVDEKLGSVIFNTSLDSIAGGQSVPPEVQKEVEKIFQKLVDALEEKPYNFVVKVIPSPDVNAFALPGGKITIFTGLLKKVETPEEVAGVLAHEIIHATKRHGLKKMVQHLGMNILIYAVIGNDISTVSDLLLKNSKEFLGLHYSRNMENEADELGFALMKKAGIHPKAFQSFLKKLPGEQGKLQMATEWLSTHPLTQKRIQAIGQMLEKNMQNFQEKSLDVDWQYVQKVLE